jgi:hypothetical protein
VSLSIVDNRACWKSANRRMLLSLYRHRLFSHVGKVARCSAVLLPWAEKLEQEILHPVFHLRLYSQSILLSFPVRRRRRQVERAIEDNDNADESPDTTASEIAQTEFDRAASFLVNKVYKALKPMVPLNDNFFLSRGEDTAMGEYIMIDLGAADGQYNIQVDNEQQLLLMQTPISGQTQYVFSKRSGDWISVDDGHIFEGLLVRDLIRQCRGVPKL